MLNRKVLIIIIAIMLFVGFLVIVLSTARDQHLSVANDFVQALSEGDSETTYNLMGRELKNFVGGQNQWDETLSEQNYANINIDFSFEEEISGDGSDGGFLYIFSYDGNEYSLVIYTSGDSDNIEVINFDSTLRS